MGMNHCAFSEETFSAHFGPEHDRHVPGLGMLFEKESSKSWSDSKTKLKGTPLLLRVHIQL